MLFWDGSYKSNRTMEVIISINKKYSNNEEGII